MPQLTCTIDHLPYGGVVYREGDRFFASDEDARLLKGWGKAKDYVGGYATRSLTPAEAYEKQALALDATPQPKRRGRPPKYARADLRAED